LAELLPKALVCVDGLRVRGEGKIANASDCLGQTAKDPPILPLMQPVERKRELQVRSHIDNTCMILHANIHLYIYISVSISVYLLYII
jgi:hypothetical protein